MSERLADLVALVEQEKSERAAAVARYQPTIEVLGRMVDQLCELHTELDPDDRLQQTLGSLAFLWGYVEDELRAAAGVRPN
jgi:hypothetical protein